MTTTTTDKPKRASKRRSVPAPEPAAAISPATAEAILGDGRHPVGTLVHLDPTTLTLEENVRKDVGLDADFLADVAANGVMHPVLAHYDTVGQLLVYEGQRRTLAAVEAGNEACATVPVYITQAAGDREERISIQDRANRLRTQLTTRDQVAAWQELALFGRSAETIAKKQRAPQQQVQAALAAAASKIAVETAEQAPEIPLDRLAAIAEFDEDPQAQQELRDIAVDDPDEFDWAVQARRDDRDRARAITAATTVLEAAGVQILDGSWWSHKGGADLRNLGLTEEEHSDCPGRAATVRSERVYNNTDGVVAAAGFEAVVTHGCTNWRKHGHKHRNESTASKPKTSELPPQEQEAEKARRRAVIENNKASETSTELRRRFVIDLLQRKSLPDDAPQAVAEILRDKHDADYSSHGVTATLLGGKEPTQAQLGKSKHTALAYLLAEAFARVEGHMAGNEKDWWRSQNATRIAYLTRLKSWGYSLSPLEAAYVAGTVKDLVL